MSLEPILLAPEEAIAEVHPYRRVWRTSWAEVWLLAGVVLAVWALTAFGALPEDVRDVRLKAALALWPLALWLAISYRGERRAPQPRPYILGTLVLGALVASGVAVHLDAQLFRPDEWLPKEGFFGRVLGYTLTVGFAAAFLKYLALRYSIWPAHIHQRQDGIAYGLAVSLGFATVYNLRFALLTEATLSATALRVASNTYPHLAAGAVLGFFLAELIVGRVPIFWLPFGLLFTAWLSGVHYGFRAIAIVGGLSTASAGSSPIRGFFLALGMVAAVYLSTAFIIANADARARHVVTRREAL